MSFEAELKELINKYGKENDSNTPDYILAEFLLQCLVAFNYAIIRRAKWFGRMDEPASMNQISIAPGKEG